MMGAMPDRPRRASLLREPLVHFVAMGAILFGAHAAVSSPPAAGAEAAPILVSEAFVEGLRVQHRRRSGRAPTADEVEALVRQHVREEVLYREARAFGLDRGDAIVRRRLVQKMEFLLAGTVEVDDPTDADLEAWVRAHPDRFARPERITFTHVFFSRDRRAGSASEDAARALRDLLASGVARAPERGDPFLLQYDFERRSRADVAGAFGDAFAEALFGEAPGRWGGPIDSAYGSHLVRVTAREPGGPPALDDVRERAAREWLEERRAQAVERRVGALVEAADVRRDAAPAPGADRR